MTKYLEPMQIVCNASPFALEYRMPDGEEIVEAFWSSQHRSQRISQLEAERIGFRTFVLEAHYEL